MSLPLCPAEILLLTGADAGAFAQTQFTSDVKALAAGHWQWSAWLDPQGRVRCFFALLHVDTEQLVAWLPLGGAVPMQEALARFVMRAKVKLHAHTDWSLYSLSPADSSVAGDAFVVRDGGFAFAQPAASPRAAWIAPVNVSDTDSAALARWRLDDIAAGLPLIAPELASEFVAQALDLERIDAIRFDKGCYPGQEIVARLHFRGGNKRHLQRLSIDSASVAVGSVVIDAEQKTIGRILYSAPSSASTSEALAVLADSAEPRSLHTAEGHAIRVLSLLE